MAAEPIPRNVHPKVGSARGRVAALIQNGADPDLIDAARAQLAEAKAEAAVTRITAAGWPAEFRAKLACLLLAGGGDNAT